MNCRHMLIRCCSWLLSAACAAAVSGCCFCKDGGLIVDAEGFAWYSNADIGRATSANPGDFYVLRYEHPAKEPFEDGRKYLGTKWEFVEVRQLGDSLTIIKDGVLSKSGNRIPGRNWRRRIPPLSRNVRIKFVDKGYTLSADGKADAPAGFTALFNGKNLTGWHGCSQEDKFHDSRVRRAMIPEDRWAHQAKADELMKDHWHVRDGVLFFDGLKGGYNIAAEKDYGNVEVIVDWRLLRVYGDSCIYLRGRYEIQVLDSFGRGKTDCHFMGALYDLVEPSESAEKPAGEWQHIDMTIYKRHLTVVLNGVKIIDNKPIPGVTPGAIDGDEFVPGPILLQGDHSNASFRNMVLVPILSSSPISQAKESE